MVALAVDVATAKGGEASRTVLQEVDKNLEEIRKYLHEMECYPRMKKCCSQARDGTDTIHLYRVMPDSTLRLIPSSKDRWTLFKEVHAGVFGGHLKDNKIYSQLARSYWWLGMRRDIRIWCRSCMTCATRQVGRPIHPPLVPLPVSRAFDRVGVDVIQFVKSRIGNKYASGLHRLFNQVGRGICSIYLTSLP